MLTWSEQKIKSALSLHYPEMNFMVNKGPISFKLGIYVTQCNNEIFRVLNDIESNEQDQMNLDLWPREKNGTSPIKLKICHKRP